MSPYENAHSRSGHGYREMNLNNKFQHYYRPQTKFAKVMFLHVSVILSRGGIPACLAVLQAHTRGGGRLRGLAGGLQAHTQGGVSQHALSQTPPDGYCCGRYASYWNAFLFEIDKGLLTCFPGFLLWITPYQQ